MRAKKSPSNGRSENSFKAIRSASRRRYFTEEKIQIVLQELRAQAGTRSKATVNVADRYARVTRRPSLNAIDFRQELIANSKRSQSSIAHSTHYSRVLTPILLLRPVQSRAVIVVRAPGCFVWEWRR